MKGVSSQGLGISAKLIGMAAFLFLVFGILAGAVFLTFQHIEDLLKTSVEQDIRENIANAEVLKELSTVFADAALVSSTFYRNEEFLRNKGQDLIRRAKDIESKSSSTALREPLEEYSLLMQSVIDDCSRINRILRRSDTLEQEIEKRLTSLERTVTDKKVAQIIAGEDPVFMEQLGVAISGYRETVLQISVAVLRNTMSQRERFSSVLPAIDALMFRFQTLTASEPGIAVYGPQLIGLLRQYRAVVVEYSEAAGALRHRQTELDRAQQKVLAVMSEIDGRIAKSTTGVTGRIAEMISKTNIALLVVTAAVQIALAIMTIYFIIANIRKPMTAICEGIELFRAGRLDTRISLDRSDEWSTIEQALNRASAALLSSQSALEAKVTELQKEIEARQRAEAESSLLEEQLRHAQKMEAIGTLAGGVAHDFNNMLTAIIGYGNMAVLRLPAEDPVQNYLRQILTAADRGATLTQSLLAFSRRQLISLEPVDLNAVILAFEPLLRRVAGESLRLDLRLSPVSVVIVADRAQIEQVLMNLVINARDALAGDGLVTIETGSRIVSGPEAEKLGLETDGVFARLSISDNGAGMDEETAKRIFEPFFTTKEVGKGTGLGLAMVYGIVQQHRGSISVVSTVGAGTRFDILIPTTPEMPTEPSEPSGEAPPGGSETILLAEDQSEVRGFIRSLLEQYGYTVIEAVNGTEAVEVFSKTERIDLMLLDVMMPEMNGREALDAIRATTPGVKALFLSGYTGDVLSSQGILDNDVCLMTKPVSPWQLLRRVREILDSSTCTGA